MITGVVQQISAAVCAALIDAGYAIASQQRNVIGATNTTPIVVTTDAPHGFAYNRADVTISGVTGNTAANAPVVGIVTGDSTLALYTNDPATGALIPVAGTGVYTGGGIVQSSLVGGRILLGVKKEADASAPPRIVMSPIGSAYDSKRVTSGFLTNAELALQRQARSLATDQVMFRVYCWGGNGVDDEVDFDLTQVLADQVIQSVQVIASGCAEPKAGTWADQSSRSAQATRLGHVFVFTLAIDRPVLDVLLPYAPSNLAGIETLTFGTENVVVQ